MLRSAVAHNKIDACRLLIELGAKVTGSAFAQASYMEMVELLLPHLSQSDISTSGILIGASLDFVRELLASQIVNVNDVNRSGESALLEACVYRNCTNRLGVLLEFGADVHVRGSRVAPGKIFKGDTPCKFSSIWVEFVSFMMMTLIIGSSA